MQMPLTDSCSSVGHTEWSGNLSRAALPKFPVPPPSAIMRLPLQILEEQQVHFRVSIPTGIPNHHPGEHMLAMSFIHSAGVPSPPCSLFLSGRFCLFLPGYSYLFLSGYPSLPIFLSLPFSHPSADGPAAAFACQLAVRQSVTHSLGH